jgi:Cu-processing system permease protein
VPATIHGGWSAELAGTVATLLALGVILIAVFIGLALWIAIRVEDKARGLGIAVALWLALAIVYDGMVLVGATMFADYPLERPLVAAMLANPIDLARLLLLLRFDTSALMGYTGATFERFFGDAAGLAVASAAVALWLAIPAWRGSRAFQRKDF